MQRDGPIWAMFYCGLVSIALHPRQSVEPDLDALARLADEMLLRFLERFPCPS